MTKTTFYEFLSEEGNTFPKAVEVGKTKNNKPRTRWKKSQVLAWIDLLGSQ